MGQLLKNLGNKDSGHLIRSNDWNTLVNAVDALEILVGEKIPNLEKQVADLTADQVKIIEKLDETRGLVGKLEGAVSEIDRIVTTVSGDYLKITLATTRLNYPLGELAVIEARVTDLLGDDLDLTVPDSRPWIDFVASWGLIKPVPGFISRGGVGERTISVQVNADGIARIRVRAEHGEGIPDAEEEEVSQSLGTKVGNLNLSVAQYIMDAQTPMEASQKGAFKVLADEYDRESARGVRRYVDAAYLRFSPQNQRGIFFKPGHQWRDHRATVLAFVKPDSDPTTADHCLGSSSIQVTFRDWVSPFVELDYLSKTRDQAAQVKKVLVANIDPDFGKSVNQYKTRIKEFVIDKGWLGRQRNLKAVREAIDELDVDQPPFFFQALKQSVRDAVSMQRTIDSVQLTTADAENELALDVFTNSSLRADQDTDVIKKGMQSVQEEFSDVKRGFEKVRELEKEVLKYDVRDQVNLLRGDLEKAGDELKKINEKVLRLDFSSDITKIKGELTEVGDGVKRATRDLADANGTIAAIDRRTKDVQKEAEVIATKQNTMQSQIVNLSGLNVTDVQGSVGQIGAILNRIDVLEKRRPIA